ncbi:hypothetical protein D7241_14960 [Stutzerimonas sp. VN223-3]|uniref:hypothetical protein n=1 Tax=Stutzerimonas sp. VN223-3 TaxID=3384601 RepID=UPI0038B4F139
MYQFPEYPPIKSKPDMWALQNFLLKKAEELIGAKDQTKTIFQPTFEGDRPCIMNSVQGDGAWASLSSNASNYWPTALYELAHETIHLLDPTIGFTNYLEEGIAVAFSLELSRSQTNHPMPVPTDKFYGRALELVNKLPENPFVSAREIRKKCQKLSLAKPQDLKELFPEIDEETAHALCSECNFT